jgi:short-subunit dehydrogenase
VRADLVDYGAVEALWKTVTELGRPLEVAVLNAGIAVGGAFAGVDPAKDLRLIDLNVTSVVHLAKWIVVDMIPRGRDRILMTSSVSATQPTPYETTYGPSRAFGKDAVIGGDRATKFAAPRSSPRCATCSCPSGSKRPGMPARLGQASV